LAGLVGYRRSTIWKVLKRHGCSQRRRTPPQRFTRRYEWAEPGALLHMDAKQLAVFTEPWTSPVSVDRGGLGGL
jgi:hypothetical protein